MRILWFVNYGPDKSHMWSSKVFEKLRDAIDFAGKLPKTPYGGARPYKIERAEYRKSRVYGDTVKFTAVDA